MSAATVDAPLKRRGAVLSEKTYVTLGTAICFLGGCAWLWSSMAKIEAGQAAQSAKLVQVGESQQRTRDEVAEVGDAQQKTAVEMSALKELVTFQLSAQNNTLQELKARLDSFEERERLRLVEAAGTGK